MKVFAALLGLGAAAVMLYSQFERHQNVTERASNRMALAVAESVMRNADAVAAADGATTNEDLIDALVVAAGEAYLDPEWTISDEAAIRANSCVALTIGSGLIVDVTEVTSHVRLEQTTDTGPGELVVGEGPCPA